MNMNNFLTAIQIDKHAKHHRCPECGDILLTMTGGHILVVSYGLLDEIEPCRLPDNFDPVSLPLLMCRACRQELALIEAESLLEGIS